MSEQMYDTELEASEAFSSKLLGENVRLSHRVAELEAAIQAWNDTIGFDEHIEAVRVLQGFAKG